MANNILTPTMITREALRVLHQKSNFIGTVNRQYDDRFAQTGAKIGTTLNVRMPAKFTVRTNATLSAQDYQERSTPLSVSSQYGVDVSFTTVDLTMSLDDFSKRIIAPAMAQLAAKIEGDCLAVAYKSVGNYINATTNNSMTYSYFMGAGAQLTRSLAPLTDRTALLNPASKVAFLDTTKALFHAVDNLESQFKEGKLLDTGGFAVYENTLLPNHTTGSLAGSPVVTSEPTNTTTSNSWTSNATLSITGATSATTLAAGDIITISGVYDVHPETKVNTGILKRFQVQNAITLTTAANTYTTTIRPGLMTGSGNAYQNVSLSGVTVVSGAAITLVGAASTAFAQDLFYHQDAFVFATADLEDVSKYGANCARASQDGISMRYAQQYAIASDQVATRFDILWGFAPLYSELATVHRTTASLLNF